MQFVMLLPKTPNEKSNPNKSGWISSSITTRSTVDLCLDLVGYL